MCICTYHYQLSLLFGLFSISGGACHFGRLEIWVAKTQKIGKIARGKIKELELLGKIEEVRIDSLKNKVTKSKD